MKRISLCALLVALVSGGHDSYLIAQTTRPLPSVSIRRLPLSDRVVPGDFNGDGTVDLAGTHSEGISGGVVVALGKGDGTFNQPQAAPFINGRALATGDFNKNGRLDLIAADDISDMPLRLLPGNGDGTFRAPVQIGAAVINRVLFAKVADFDGDGNLDVAMGFIDDDGGDGVLIYAGRGDGTFAETGGPLVTGAGSSPLGAVVADVNGDRKPDLVVASHDAHKLSVFLNQGAFNFSASDIPLDAQANDVAAVDLNHDGKMDLLVAATHDGSDDLFYITGQVYVLSGNGNGTFAQPVKYDTAPGAWQLVVGDFNRDGVLDVATANRSAKMEVDFCGKIWDSVSILPGNTNGTFGPASSFSLADQRNSNDMRFRNSVSSLTVADVNGDKQPDLIASWGAILLNQAPDPNWPPQVASVTAIQPNPSTDLVAILEAKASDSDQDLLSWHWTDDLGDSIEPSPRPCVPVPRSRGVHRFTVTVDDGHGHTAVGSVDVDFGSAGATGPTVMVTQPTAGAVVPAGQPFTIRWMATAGMSPISRINVQLSRDGGISRASITECENLPASATSCQWNNPPATETAHVFVLATDSAVRTSMADSGRFAIRGSPGSIIGDGWTHADVGAVGTPGTATFDGFIWNGEGLTVSGSGADIWGTADEFHYAWKLMSGDFEIETRVSSLDAVNAWTKAGLMIRASALDASAPHASIFVTPSKGVAFQRRPASGGTSINTSGAALAAPVWLRLARHADVVSAYYKKALADQWTLLGQQSIAFLAQQATVAVGLAVTSHADGTLARGKFEGVYLSAIPSWTNIAIGGATGSASAANATIYTVKGSGADIWGTNDSFDYMWVPFSGAVMVTARVLTLGNTNAWAKAGLMVRESLAPGAKQVDAIVTPGKGVVMQMRTATDRVSTTVKQNAGVVPVFLRILTSPSAETGRIAGVQANYSFDGTLWHVLGQASVDMNADGFVGIAVTSHNAPVQTTATFDTVRVER